MTHLYPKQKQEIGTEMDKYAIIPLDKHELASKLMASEDNLKAVFSSLSDVFIRSKLSGEIEMISPSCFQLLGYNALELIGESMAQFYTDLNKREAMIKALFVKGFIKKNRMTLLCKNGGTVIAESDITLVNGANGEPCSIIYLIRDGSTTVKKEQEIKKLKLADIRNKAKAHIEGEEKARKRISQDLHDSLGQLLIATKRSLNQLKTVDNLDLFHETLKLMDLSIGEVKYIVNKMTPPSLIHFGIDSALTMLCAISTSPAIAIEFNLIGKYKRLEIHVETALFRITQEAINNAIKHAKSKKITVILIAKKGTVGLKIIDNGIGFSLAGLKAINIGNGISNINERVESIQAKLKIRSDSTGTEIFVTVKV